MAQAVKSSAPQVLLDNDKIADDSEILIEPDQ